MRMGAIASAVGISRQSLHGEFGTKDELGNALVLRETAAFLDGVRARLEEHPGDLAGGVADAVEFMLSATLDDPLLQTILTRAPVNGGGQTLLPLLTTRGEPLIEHAMGIVGRWVGEQWPAADRDDSTLMVESVVRLAQSHLLTQTRAPAEVARGLAQPLLSVRDGLRNLQITEAIAQAARMGAAIDTTVSDPVSGSIPLRCSWCEVERL